MDGSDELDAEVAANCWGDEVSTLVDWLDERVAARFADDSEDALGILGGLDPPPQDPSLLECCEILNR